MKKTPDVKKTSKTTPPWNTDKSDKVEKPKVKRKSKIPTPNQISNMFEPATKKVLKKDTVIDGDVIPKGAEVSVSKSTTGVEITSIKNKEDVVVYTNNTNKMNLPTPSKVEHKREYTLADVVKGQQEKQHTNDTTIFKPKT